MRVLYPLRYFPTLTETFVYRELDALVDLGIAPTIASLGRREDGALQDEAPAVPVWELPRRPLTGRLRAPGPGQRWLAEVQRDKDAARLPWLLARLGDVDRVHAHFAGEAAEWARAIHLETGLPYTVTVHAVDLFKPRPSFDRVLADAQAVVTVAAHHQDLLAARGHRAELVRCGPRLADWAGLPPPPDGPLRALFVGRDVDKKGLSDLLEAWERGMPDDARLVVVSDRADPGIRGVEVRGLLPPSAVREELARANLVVLPCRRAEDGDLDGVPVALMEALAARRPVVAGAVSGVPELVDEEVGWLVPPRRPDLLQEALLHAHGDSDERLRRGDSGPDRLRSRGFTVQAQATALAELWRRMS